MIVGEAIHVLGQGIYGASLYFLFSFAVNPKLFKKDCLNKKENKIKEFLFKAKKKKSIIGDLKTRLKERKRSVTVKREQYKSHNLKKGERKSA